MFQTTIPRERKVHSLGIVVWNTGYRRSEARNLEISNMQLLPRNIQISRFYEHFKKFREICFAHIFAKFKYFAKQLILTEPPDNVLQSSIKYVHILKV